MSLNLANVRNDSEVIEVPEKLQAEVLSKLTAFWQKAGANVQETGGCAAMKLTVRVDDHLKKGLQVQVSAGFNLCGGKETYSAHFDDDGQLRLEFPVGD